MEEQAQLLAVAPEVLARKRDYEYLARGLPEGEPAPSILQGWRRPIIGERLGATVFV